MRAFFVERGSLQWDLVPYYIKMTANAYSWFYSNIYNYCFGYLCVYFISFHCISKQYKLRKRDDSATIHLFAEEYFEKELRGQKGLM